MCFNVNAVPETEKRPRALLIYRVLPFRLPSDHPAFLGHSNMKCCRAMADVLDDLGYGVDVADVQARRLRARVAYDLLISHTLRVPNFSRLTHPGTVIIYWATGTSHPTHNHRVQQRLADIQTRRGCVIRDCPPLDESMPLLPHAHAIICIGSEGPIVATWREHFAGPIYPIDNMAVPCARPARRETEAGRHFLYLGSTNQVPKGLHLLLELFPRYPDIHLHVAGSYENERDFCRCYARELRHTPNVHPWGWVQPNSAAWRDVTTRCAFSILPTCAEGQAGSVIQSMYAGLVPLVTRESGVAMDDFGFLFHDDSPASIDAGIQAACRLPWPEIVARSMRAQRVAETRYSEARFRARLHEILRNLLGRG